MSTAKLRAKERGLLLGTVSLTFYLVLVILPVRYLGESDVSLRLWVLALVLTYTVQGLLWLILRRGDDVLAWLDPRFLHLPVLGASLLFNFYLYAAPDTRSILLLGWIIVLLFGSGRAGFAEVMVWSLIQLVGYVAVLSVVHDRIEGFSLPQEIAYLWMFASACFGIAVMFERLRSWLRKAVAQRQSSETAARESEARLRQVIDLVPHMIFAKDREGRFLLVNRAVADAYGATIEQLLSKTDSDFASSPAEAEAFRADDLAVIESGEPLIVPEERLTDARGKQRILHTTKIPFTVGGSEEPALLGVAIDITELKQAEEERRQLEGQVQHLQKLESLGVMAGGIAHDFNNILVSVLGHAELALEDLPPDSAARPTIARIVSAAERAADLVGQLLAYSGHGQFVVETLDLSRIIDSVQDLISASISKKARVEIDDSAGPVYVEADKVQLHQVLMNLMTNASDALEDRPGEIRVTTGSMDADRDRLLSMLCGEELPAGRYAFIEVADDGCGMDEATRDKIFDPFFSTKFVGRGLGLAAVLGIARGHRGAIRVDTAPGAGTTVRLLLPEVPAPVTETPAAPPEPRPAALPDGAILVVDDDPAVRELVTETLERSGGTSIVARDGAEGVEAFRREQSRVALVLLDMTMPVMSGEEAFRELCRIRPDVPIILMSGFNEQLATTGFGRRRPAGFLHKPFSPRALIELIGQVLRGADARLTQTGKGGP